MITAIDVAWAAGFLEGEGCFTSSAKHGVTVSAPQMQREPLERLQAIFGGFLNIKKNPSGSGPLFFWAVHGKNAAAVTMTVLTFLSPRRYDQAVKLLNKWKAALGKGYKRHNTHCSHGHLYDVENTMLYRGKWRRCRICDRARHAKHNLRRKAA